MYLLDFVNVQKNGKEYRIATFFDPNARRKVVTKFLNKEIIVPMEKMVTDKDLQELEQVNVSVDLEGNVQEIE